jgi:hypothetical protein
LDAELVRTDRQEVVIAGDECVRVVGGCERDEVVVFGVAADVGYGRIWEEEGAFGERAGAAEMRTLASAMTRGIRRRRARARAA